MTAGGCGKAGGEVVSSFFGSVARRVHPRVAQVGRLENDRQELGQKGTNAVIAVLSDQRHHTTILHSISDQTTMSAGK